MLLKGCDCLNFLKNLEGLMRERKLNRSELARACGLSTSTVNSWWNRSSENISLQTLLKLSKFFNISLEELVNGPSSSALSVNLKDFSPAEFDAIYKFVKFIKLERKG